MRRAGNVGIWAIGIALGLSLASCATAQYGQLGYDYGQPDNGQYGYNQPHSQPGYGEPDYYNELSAYGQWVNTPEYGTVWMPSVEPGFQPYATNGRWIVTEYGNTWVSDYAWGRVPFHYGRWYLDRFGRWAWVPGNEWAPAWVSWRSGGGYYGWAPLGPGLNSHVNVNIPPAWWTFVPQVYITSPRLYNYCVPRPRVVNVYQNTTIINNVYRVDNRAYAYGPRREEIESVTRQRVPVYRVQEVDRVGWNNRRDYASDRNRLNNSPYSRPNYQPRQPADNRGYGESPRPAPESSGYSQQRPSWNRGGGSRNESNESPVQPNGPTTQPEPSNRSFGPRGSAGTPWNRDSRTEPPIQRQYGQPKPIQPQTERPSLGGLSRDNSPGDGSGRSGFEPRRREPVPGQMAPDASGSNGGSPAGGNPAGGSFPGQRSGSRGPR